MTVVLVRKRGAGGPPPAPPVNTVAPVVTGTATVGQLLSTTDGTWTGDAPIVFTYQWQRDGVDIGGATANTYTLVVADATFAVRCVVTGTNGVGNSSANSNATAAVVGTFGVTTIGGSFSGFHADGMKYISLATLPSSGDVTKLTCHMKNDTAVGQVCKGIIYADAAGPTALKGTSNEVTMAAFTAAAWVDLTFAAPVALTAGDYWLGIFGGPTGNKIQESYAVMVNGSRYQLGDTYADGASDPFGASIPDNSLISIYGTYS